MKNRMKDYIDYLNLDNEMYREQLSKVKRESTKLITDSKGECIRITTVEEIEFS